MVYSVKRNNMSLIIAYISKKGCVMAADKRKVGYFGDKENLKLLEDDLYGGVINSDEAFKKRAEELGISIKITDDASKLKIVGNCVRGEVSTKGTFETRRRRIYGTANGYQLVELLGSDVTSRKAGETGMIIFGNKFAKKMAQDLISKKLKPSSSLKAKGEQLEEFIKEIADKTPSVGKNVDVLIQSPNFNSSEAQKHLNITIDNDIKVLTKFRQSLTEQIVQQSVEIAMANKIINDGDVGRVVSVDGNILYVQLNSGTQAMDGNWKQLAAPGQNVIMFTESNDVKVGDVVTIEDEDLCLKKDKSSLTCKVILCSL